jgi:hypothetical protein
MAAGLGYIEFATGDILTAAAANGYLASQTVMVFADAAARTAAITSPQEGMFSYLKDTNATQYYSGSAWVTIGGASPLTTKGDLYTYSTTDARLGVGTNGQVLVADSTAATGIKWATPASSNQILQIVQGTTGTSTSNSTSTYADTTLTATITPSSASNKILVFASHAGIRRTLNTNAMDMRLVRGSTEILEFVNYAGSIGSTAENYGWTASLNYLDAPATTSATTYKTQFRSSTNQAATAVQSNGGTSVIILMEISGI